MLSYAAEPVAPRTPQQNGVGGASASAGTSVIYKPTQITGAAAGAALDQTFLLMPGLIRCVLDTAIDSTLPGPLLCHLPAPVINAAGVILMPKDTAVIGNYSNEIKQGQGRLMSVSLQPPIRPTGCPCPWAGRWPIASAVGASMVTLTSTTLNDLALPSC